MITQQLIKNVCTVSSALLLVTIVSCGGENPASSAPSSISGIWDASEILSDGTFDVRYLEFKDDGTYISYDYAGDDFNRGDNCYIVFNSTYTNISGSLYRLSGIEDPVNLSIVGGDVLVATTSDADDYDGDGDTNETISSGYPALVGIDPIDPIDFIEYV